MRNLEEGVGFALSNGADVKTLQEPYNAVDEDRVLRKACNDFEPDVIIVDLPYQGLPSDYTAICPKGTQTWFIDDFRFQNPGASFYFNSSILALDRVRPPIDDPCRYFLGPDYFLFSPPDNCPPQRTAGKFNVLLTFGGSDPTQLTAKVVRLLKAYDLGDTIFRIVLGPGYSGENTIEQIIHGGEEHFQIIHRPKEIFPYLDGADMVVCSGGRTMYELNYLQRPFIPVATTDIEAQAIAAFLDKGLIDHGLAAWDPERFKELFAKQHLALNKYRMA